jgi:hypothetical protein
MDAGVPDGPITRPSGASVVESFFYLEAKFFLFIPSGKSISAPRRAMTKDRKIRCAKTSIYAGISR